ncbi:MAG: hypothetical protein IJ652_06100 [Bacteroidales bacterium]|nr:hypothetical protein [Bacteroidales bacterium]
MKIRTLILILLCMAAFSQRAEAGVFVKGLDAFVEYTAGHEAATLSFTTRGKQFRAIALWFEGSVAVAVEDAAGQRTIVYRNGAPAGGKDLPKIGFQGASESRSNAYLLGIHDFTNDGQPELVLSVSDGRDGLAVYVLQYDGYNWRLIGEMLTAGKGLGGCRVFRQALTMKNAEGTLFTWTCHGSTFDFLSSDKVNDPTVLY